MRAVTHRGTGTGFQWATIRWSGDRRRERVQRPQLLLCRLTRGRRDAGRRVANPWPFNPVTLVTQLRSADWL